jgi:3-isopropylmalate/(R)-2-methylmalate dehydratase small subunit
MDQLQGRAFVFGDNVDTDQIYPGKYLELTDPQEIGSHVMEGADPDFPAQAQKGDIVVAGRNFGCGSSREHAVITLLEGGVGAVIAQSFGRIFYRNAINRGLPVITVPGGLDVEVGELITINLEQGTIIVGDQEYQFKPYPREIRAIIDAGGVIPVIKEELKS